MLHRSEWNGILAGLLLLVGSPLFDRATRVPAQRLPTQLRTRESAQGVLRAEIRDVLEQQNRRLDHATSGRITEAVLGCARRQGLDPELVLHVMVVESGARPDVRSPKGAIGLMQVMPYMFEQLEIPGNIAFIETNVEAGCILLADNIRRLGEDRGVLSYFWGSQIRGDGYLRRVRNALPDLDLTALPPAQEDR